MRKSTVLFIFIIFCMQIMPALYGEVLFTDNARKNTEQMRAVMKSWNDQATSDPSGRVAAWLKKKGESAHIGNITVDFDDTRLAAGGGALGIWNINEKTITLPGRLFEPYLSAVIAHEAGGHAYFDTLVPYIDKILPPRYAVAMSMIREINAFIQEAKMEGMRGNNFSIGESFTESPKLENDIITFFYRLKKYISDINPSLDDETIWQKTCNEFALGFLANENYINRGINSLEPQFYELMYVGGRYYTPPVLNRRSAGYMANINLIMQKYLETAMPDGFRLSFNAETFMSELSHNIDAVDIKRNSQKQVSCLHYDRILAQSINKVETLGSDVRDGGMVIGPDIVDWLDALMGPQKAVFEVVPTLRAIQQKYF